MNKRLWLVEEIYTDGSVEVATIATTRAHAELYVEKLGDKDHSFKIRPFKITKDRTRYHGGELGIITYEPGHKLRRESVLAVTSDVRKEDE